MKCPFCKESDTQVIESRESAPDLTRRRRECLKCKRRFTTYEKLDSGALRVVKKDGSREVFQREKVETGIIKSCEKRPIAYNQIKAAVDDIEAEIRSKYLNEVPSKTVGHIVLKKLKRMDKVAYVRFASVYLAFDDVAAFDDVVKKLLKRRKQG